MTSRLQGAIVVIHPSPQAALPDCETEGCGQLEAEPVYVELEVQNTHRAVGTTLSHEVKGVEGAEPGYVLREGRDK